MRQWREEGSFSLYAEAMRAAAVELKNCATVKDNTFITNLEAPIEHIEEKPKKSRKYQRKRELNQREEMLRDTQNKAEGVMSRVLQGLEMLEEAPDMKCLREKASLHL